MAHRFLTLALASIGTASLLAEPVPPQQSKATRPQAFGAVSGLVKDGRGVAQMGAAVLLTARDGTVLHRLYTDVSGFFQFDKIPAGMYTLRVTLTSFLPAIRENFSVQPGDRAFLTINLSSLTDTLASFAGQGRKRPESDEDWKWVIRSSGATRPVLRYAPQPSVVAASARKPAAKARIEFLGGAGQSNGAGGEADFSTAFSLAQTLFRDTTLLLGGALGYERSTPASAFRAMVRRERGDGTAPEFSVTTRQVFLPGAYFTGMFGQRDRMQSTALAFRDSLVLAGVLKIEYGAQWDSVDFLGRVHTVSPHGRAVYALGENTALRLAYGQGVPARRRHGDPLRDVNAQLAQFPRMTLRDGRLAVESDRHAEIAVERQISAGGAFEAAVFRDDAANLAVNASAGSAAAAGGDLLPDPFSRNYAYNAGRQQSSGFRVAYRQKMGGHMQGTVAYSRLGMLAADERGITPSDIAELRRILQAQKRHALAVKLNGFVPGSKTAVAASYKWINRPAVHSFDSYDESLGQADPGLNFTIRQPLPQFVPFLGRMEAVADIRNALGQGYVAIPTSDGSRVILLQNIRSVRGGLSFNF